MKKSILSLLMILLLSTCQKLSKPCVNWFPNQPKQGEIVTINYNSKSHDAKLVGVSQIFLFCQCFFDSSDSMIIVPMKKSKDSWTFDITPPKKSYLLSIKFEDDLNRPDDNKGRGWSIPLLKPDGNIQENTYYTLGQIYSGKIRPEAFPDFRKAIEKFEQELSMYPENSMAWFDKWEAEQTMNGMKEKTIKQLDSLLMTEKENATYLKLAFYTNWQLVGNIEKSIAYGEKYLALNPQSREVEKIKYALIFLKNQNDAGKQIAELQNFIEQNDNTTLMEPAIFRLGNLYMSYGQNQNAIKTFEKLIKLDLTDISHLLILISMEIKNENYAHAQELLELAEKNNNFKNITARIPWTHPIKREKQLNYNFCQLYSTKANLDYAMHNYTDAIKNRKAALNFGTPFPAFEWMRIGDSYLQLNDLQEAKKAFIKALSINPQEKEGRMKLQQIYFSENNTHEGFDLYLDQLITEEQKKSAKPAPEFEAIDLAGNKVKLSDMKGKIIVLYFWDTWSSACKKEIPELNNLVADLAHNNFVNFIAISVEYKTSIESFLQKQQFEYSHFYNGSDIKKKFNIIGFPTHIVIDHNGLIRYKYIGYTPGIRNKLKENILTIMEEINVIS